MITRIYKISNGLDIFNALILCLISIAYTFYDWIGILICLGIDIAAAICLKLNKILFLKRNTDYADVLEASFIVRLFRVVVGFFIVAFIAAKIGLIFAVLGFGAEEYDFNMRKVELTEITNQEGKTFRGVQTKYGFIGAPKEYTKDYVRVKPHYADILFGDSGERTSSRSPRLTYYEQDPIKSVLSWAAKVDIAEAQNAKDPISTLFKSDKEKEAEKKELEKDYDEIAKKYGYDLGAIVKGENIYFGKTAENGKIKTLDVTPSFKNEIDEFCALFDDEYGHRWENFGEHISAIVGTIYSLGYGILLLLAVVQYIIFGRHSWQWLFELDKK